MHKLLRHSGQVDMLHGPLAGKIFTFALPLIASGILQQSFNAVDVAFVGRYANAQSIAAVGSNGPIVSILVNLFIGIAVGANVVIANHLGSGDKAGCRRSVDTVAILALVSGLLLTLLGIFLARPMLEAMSCPPDVIDLASRYLAIFFCGMPFAMIYNFGAAIMRSIGDTRMPLYSLFVATLCNILLDWLFTGTMGMGVEGVAWATVISNAVNAGILVLFLTQEPDPVTLRFRRWKLSRPDLGKMLRIGVPAGLQGMIFSFSNIFIQAAINRFGAYAVAGSAAALTYEAYCYYIVVAFCQAAIAFAGQNYGAGLAQRCKRVARICMAYAIVCCGLSNGVIIWQAGPFLSVFTHDPEVVRWALVRFHTVLAFQAIAATYEVSGAYMRALGYSLTPMLLTIFGTCVLRLLWVWIFPSISYTFETLLAIYPITWIVTGIAVTSAALIVQRRAFRKLDKKADKPSAAPAC